MSIWEEVSKHPILAFRTLIFYIGYISYIFIHGSLVMLFIWFLPKAKRFDFITFWAKFNVWWLKLTCNVNYEVISADNVNKVSNGVVLSKHQSGWETFFLQGLFKPQVTVMKKELLMIPIFGWAIRLLEPITIDRSQRSNALKQVIQKGQEKLKQGYWVVLFPEGTRVDPGEQGEFSAGGAMLAHKAGYPIIPVAHNSGEFWRAHRFIKYPGTIKVVVGEPMPTEGRKPKELTQTAADWINATMLEISPVERAKRGNPN